MEFLYVPKRLKNSLNELPLFDRHTMVHSSHFNLYDNHDLLTFIGGFYDFTSDLTMKDTAYTSEAIGPHTDTTYFTDPAGLQMFHLLSHTEGTGGESLLVDGFWASRFLRQNDKNVLSKVNIPWHASGNDGINITPNKPYPVLTMDSNFKATQIRWNEADRGVIPPRDSEAWYQAAKIFDQKINEPKQQYWSQLVPGRALSEFFFGLLSTRVSCC